MVVCPDIPWKINGGIGSDDGIELPICLSRFLPPAHHARNDLKKHKCEYAGKRAAREVQPAIELLRRKHKGRAERADDVDCKGRRSGDAELKEEAWYDDQGERGRSEKWQRLGIGLRQILIQHKFSKDRDAERKRKSQPHQRCRADAEIAKPPRDHVANRYQDTADDR